MYNSLPVALLPVLLGPTSRMLPPGLPDHDHTAHNLTITSAEHSRVPGWDVMASVGGLSEGGSKRLLSVYVTVPPCRVLRYPLQVIGGNRLPLLTMIHSS